MSEFHENIRKLLEDIYSFLTETLQQEMLSSNALTRREDILLELHTLNQKYPQLHLEFSSTLDEHVPSSPLSPTSYIDMHGNNTLKGFVGQQDTPVFEESYELCGSERSATYADSQAYLGSEDGQSLSDCKYAALPATQLKAFDKYGFLEKKGRERFGGLLTKSQRRWYCIKDGLMYYYENKTDQAQKGAIPLSGYEVRPIQQVKDNKKSKKTNFYFELVCPGRQTYQFSALCEKDLKQWIAAIERNSKGTGKLVHQDIFNPSERNEKRGSLVYDDSGDPEDIYEFVEEEEDSQTRSNKESISKNSAGDQVAGQQCLSGYGKTSQMHDYRNIYVCLWDCKGSDETELDFSYGDVIHILSKEYDSYEWWIGELNGKVGFVPKPYLMELYSVQ